ncbi:MAG: hypothetical protein IT352_15435 [Gemmatimonadales bacterium]|nr:hypothetical protein [Gemmatimonadales bacterium]
MSPLGRYSAVAAVVAALGLITAAVLFRLVYREGDQWLDGAAMIAIGAVFASPVAFAAGSRSGEANAAATINGLQAKVDAANIRLDAAGAPSAPVAAAQLGVTPPTPRDGH